MADPFNLLQAPVDQSAARLQNFGNTSYATPEEIKQRYDWAKALLDQSQSNVPGTKGGWTIGLRNIVDALVGGNQAYQAAQQGRQQQQGIRQSMTPYNFTGGTPAPYSFGPTPTAFTPPDSASSDAPLAASPEGAKNSRAKGSDMDKAAGITSSQESGGRYDNVTTTINPRTGQRQSAIGKYGVMDFNVGPWTQEVLGAAMTPEQFKNDPKAQDAVYKAKMGQYIQKYGPEGAGRAWIGGEGGVTHPERKDALGTSVGDYGSKFALAFNGKPSEAPAQQAITSAMSGQQQGGYAPEGGWDPKPLLPPGSFPVRPMYTHQQLQDALGNPALTVEQRQGMVAQYMNQFQPISVKVTGGTVLINPANPSQQKYISDMEKGTAKIGGLEFPAFTTFSPGGQSANRVPVSTGAPNVQNVPTRPGAPAGGSSGVLPQPGGALPFAPTGAPAATPGPQGAISPAGQAPVQVASANQSFAPETNAPTGPMGAVPPVNPAPIAPIMNKPPAAGPQVAQAGSQFNIPTPPGIAPQDWKAFTDYSQQEQLNKQREAQAGELGKQFGERYNNMQKDAFAARELRPLVDAARNILANPNSGVYTGLGANAVLDWQRLKAAMGTLVGDDKLKGAASDNEIFRKLIAGSILSQLKPMTQGTGQIRNKEIELIERYNANPLNTVAANKALVEISDRNLQRMDMFADMASDYASGAEVVDPYTKKVLLPAQGTPRGGLDFGWDKLLRNFISEHPAFTPAETKNYLSLLEQDKKAEKTSKEGTSTQFKTPSPADIQILKNDPRVRPFFEKRFGPADQYLK